MTEPWHVSARSMARLKMNRNSVKCAACGERLVARLWAGIPGVHESVQFEPCAQHRDFGLALVYDTLGELQIKRLKPVMGIYPSQPPVEP